MSGAGDVVLPRSFAEHATDAVARVKDKASEALDAFGDLVRVPEPAYAYAYAGGARASRWERTLATKARAFDDTFVMRQSGRGEASQAKARFTPGTAHASKELIDAEKLLRGSHGNAGFIPAEVASQLEGKTYRCFDTFREDVWKAVANSKYAAEFGAQNLTRMKDGLAPFTTRNQHLGGNKTYHLHHIEPISKGGTVYDLSNIIIATPKYHKEILESSYHYGRK